MNFARFKLANLSMVKGEFSLILNLHCNLHRKNMKLIICITYIILYHQRSIKISYLLSCSPLICTFWFKKKK